MSPSRHVSAPGDGTKGGMTTRAPTAATMPERKINGGGLLPMSNPRAQPVMNGVPRALGGPRARPAVGHPPRRQVVRNHPPLAAGAQYVEDRVQHEPVSIHPRPTTFAQVTNREQRLDHQPHLIGEAGGIASRGVIPLGLQVHTPVNATSPRGPVKRSSDCAALKTSHQIEDSARRPGRPGRRGR